MSSARRMSSLARCSPTSRGSSHVPRPSAARARRANTSMNLAFSDAITRSHAKARWAPMPAAVPCTLAITGHLAVEDRVDGRDRAAQHHAATLADHPLGRVGRAGGCDRDGAPPLRSAPVQKNRPVACSTTHRMARSSSARANHSPIFTRCSLVERVAGLGPVDGDGGDAVGDLEPDAVEVVWSCSRELLLDLVVARWSGRAHCIFRCPCDPRRRASP